MGCSLAIYIIQNIHMAFTKVDPKQNFPELEDNINIFWKENKIFEKQVESRPEDNKYVFYDGPPFITGLAHYGHLLGSISTMEPIRALHGSRRYLTMSAGPVAAQSSGMEMAMKSPLSALSMLIQKHQASKRMQRPTSDTPSRSRA